MKIVNIDAPKHLAKKVGYFNIPEFVLEVVRPLENDYYSHLSHHQLYRDSHLYHHKKTLPLSPIRKFEEVGYENVAVLLHTIPIYLRDSRPTEIRDENSIIDLLGAYYSNRGGDSPYIELYLKAIDDSTNNDNEFKWLFAKVLIHELAHSALDIFNQEDRTNITEKVFYNTEFGKWREESMANAVTLRIIKEYGRKRFYRYTKEFMLSQPPEYALGVLMEDFGYWDFRSVYNPKKRGVNYTLQQEWLKYAKGNPDWSGLEKWNDLLFSKIVYLFEGNYYTSEEKLVYDIVNKVVSDFESKNGRKMSCREFCSIFPYIKTGAEMSYEPSNKVKEDSRYRVQIQLDGGNYSLYYFWNNESLHKFIANTKIDLVEYQNY